MLLSIPSVLSYIKSLFRTQRIEIFWKLRPRTTALLQNGDGKKVVALFLRNQVISISIEIRDKMDHFFQDGEIDESANRSRPQFQPQDRSVH